MDFKTFILYHQRINKMMSYAITSKEYKQLKDKLTEFEITIIKKLKQATAVKKCRSKCKLSNSSESDNDDINNNT